MLSRPAAARPAARAHALNRHVDGSRRHAALFHETSTAAADTMRYRHSTRETWVGGGGAPSWAGSGAACRPLPRSHEGLPRTGDITPRTARPPSLARQAAPVTKCLLATPKPPPPAPLPPGCRSLLPPSRRPKPPTSSTAARTARSAGHANATAVHRHVQRCPCAVSPPPMPQAGLLAMPSRHRAVGSSNCCRRDHRSAEGASGGASPTSLPSPTIRCRRCQSMKIGHAPPVLLLLRLLLQRGAEWPIRQARQAHW